MFTYTSIQSHGIITPEGEKVKQTEVRVANGQGTKTVIVKDNKGIHSDTLPLTKKEMKNIQEHKFMPGFFNKSLTNVKRKKETTRKQRGKKGTRSKK